MPTLAKRLTQTGKNGRCTAHSRSGEQCKRHAALGTTVCYHHGGAAPQVQRKVQHAIARSALIGLVEPIDKDDPEANWLESFDAEHRRTVAAIRWYGAQIAALKDERDLVWGMTKMEDKGAGEFAGIDATYEAKINLYEERRFLERRHLADQHKTWLAGKLGEMNAQINRSTLDALQRVLDYVVVGMDADPHDPAIRALINDALGKASEKPAAIEA